MLGYVRTHAPELRLRDHECYRALYCGLCKSMGKCTGQCSRMSLSYDFVFLAAVRMSLLGEKLHIKRSRCIVHPLRKRPTVYHSPTLDYCADASAILTYQKLLDDCKDERGGKKLCAYLARPFFSGAYRKAKKRNPELAQTVAECLAALHTYETDPTADPSADVPASHFGNLMYAVFASGLSDTDARIAGAIGKAIGRWIYLLDAADDFEQDCRKNRFNPYRALFGETLSDEEKELIRISLIAHLSDAERAFLLIESFPASELREIIANILYLGLPNAAEKILNPKDCKKGCNR